MPTKKRPPPGSPAEAAFRDALEAKKRESTMQVLFKVARLLDEAALARVAAQRGAPKLRRSHMSLLPHIALEGTRMSDLAEKLGISKQAVTQLVDELESFGVVTREPDPDDARARRVVFTELGKRGLLDGLRVLVELEAQVSEWLGARRMATLRATLLALHDRLTAMDPEDGHSS